MVAKFWTFTLVFWICLLSICGGAGAAELELFKSERFQGGPWTLRADKITYEAPQHIIIAEGKVDIRQGERRIHADRVEVNEQTKIAQMRGNVVLVMEEDIFSGKEGEFNLATRCGEMREARLFLKKNHFHVDSALMRKTGDQSYFAEEAKVSTCDADNPVWTISARQLSVVMDGYAVGKDGVLRLAGIPVLYLPAAVMPVMATRQSGFLMPAYGQHRAGGTVVELPFYWAINNFSDATIYQNYLSNRGYMQGVEFRRHGHEESAANFRLFYINDTFDEATTNHRYWVAGMVNQQLGEWNARLTLDQVSDLNYLANFNFGYMGLNRYSRDLLTEFGRDLEQQEVQTRVSSLLLARNLAWGNFTAYSRYYERLNPLDPRLWNRLPGAELLTAPLQIGGLPFYGGVNTSYTYFYQYKGSYGDRLDFHPRLWLQQPLVMGTFLSSRVGFHETLFRIDQSEPDTPREGYVGRQLFDTKVSLLGAWSRDYGRSEGSTTFYRHTISPEITYYNIPRFVPGKYPAFDPLDQGWVAQANRNLPIRDGDDPVGGVNALTYGIGNSILGRGQTPQGQAAVRDMLWFRLSQSAFFNKTSMGLDGTSVRHHQFSDFWGELEVYPFRQVTLGTNMGLSPYKEGFDRADIKMTFMDARRQNYVSANYVFIKDFAKQINVETYLNLFQSVKTWLTYSHTFETNNQLEKRYGIIFQRQCWGVVLSYTDRPDDQRVGFTVFIPGLGEKMKRSPVKFPEEGKAKEGPDFF
jgi:LPS-assembly protein